MLILQTDKRIIKKQKGKRDNHIIQDEKSRISWEDIQGLSWVFKEEEY